MRALFALALTLLLAACTPMTADEMTRGPPWRSYTSAHSREDVAQCIARALPHTNVLPGRTETVVNQWNFEGPLAFTWVIADAGAGSTIRAWRANSLMGGSRRAEACF